MGLNPIDPGKALLEALTGAPPLNRDQEYTIGLMSRLIEAEAYLDRCVSRLENVDIATMRGLLHGSVRLDSADVHD